MNDVHRRCVNGEQLVGGIRSGVMSLEPLPLSNAPALSVNGGDRPRPFGDAIVLLVPLIRLQYHLLVTGRR
jgi:hypothetical protein